ncbi:tripartite tricarboxylate transporter substrate binding protein [Sediminicoccus rosea]|jgi:tripartite-type tricarboxylate transporter receptor subunit TctC|uniref:Tripartite tricarboxylate transporter substrate binding protein n=1 Tax=Sediminicoccus rosea TaxID=1225128 RepID=A0ABZ0PJ71_9PROT|nr:tripartite tricarboxylate transporter substrate binding protein [Sediminicoccus rosea]WPB85388.1 tripartite tricarboxylate transporter substrate binding protein [Sediminicoccus rosea]
MARFSRRGALALAAATLPAPGLRAQGIWNPTRPITLVVGFPAGGQTDFAARVVQSGLQKALGVSVAIDNRAGAGGNLGTEAVMAARPDGYTLLAGNISPMVINPHTMEGMMIDPREMVPIGLILRSSLILCTHPSLNVRNLAELRAWIAAQPRGSIQYGSTSTGSLTHIAMELFRERLGKPEMTQMAYRGSGPAMADFVAGRFSLMFDGASVVAPLVQAGQLRCVLATGRTRSPAFPDLPTAEQQGLNDFAFYTWTGLFAPRGTPPEIVARLNAALNAALGEPSIRERMTSRGAEPGGGSAEEMGRLMAEDYARWGEVVRVNQIRVES